MIKRTLDIKLLFLVIAMIVMTYNVSAQNLYINEILAGNSKTNLSPVYSEYADWIEIKNNSSTDVNISGYYLTDDLADSDKWQVPDNTIIPANGFILIWADDKDTSLHTNFKLSKDGETIGLFNSAGSVVDTITFGKQSDDISYGRLADNPSQWAFFEIPTPLAENTSEETGFAPLPQFLLPGGFYTGSQTLTIIVTDPEAEIRYTTNGKIPDENSYLYSSPIIIDSTTAIRARSFQNGKSASEIITATYFISEQINLPVVSLVTDPDNLFSDSTGIYVTGTNGISGACDTTVRNVNQDWERPVHLELFETNGETGLNQDCGIKIFGGCSRTRYPQKSFALYARSRYGKGSFSYQLFPNKPIKKFETFLLRSSADDQVFTLFRDALAQVVVSQEPGADYQAYRPAVVYINGEYWGIHNIREKVNEHYVVENFDVPEEIVNLIERNPEEAWNVNHGSAQSYNAMIDYIETHNLNNNEYYNYVAGEMDIDQYINYMIGHIYLAIHDWPGNNIRFWKADSGNYSKWRWINYDMDPAFTYTTEDIMEVVLADDGPYWPNPPWSTFLFRSLLENDGFRNKFIQRYAFLMNTIYEPQQVIRLIDSLQLNIAPEIPNHIAKWGGKTDPDFNEPDWQPEPIFNSVAQWENNVDVMRQFALQRPQYAREHVINHFGLSGTAGITVNSNLNSAGKLTIVDMPVVGGSHTGTYFKGVPLKLKAQASFGFKFLYWKIGNFEFDTPEADVTILADETITAYFEEGIEDSQLVIINEINYNSSDEFDPGDWIELYNRSSEAVNISNWYFRDEDDTHTFIIPEGTEIPSNGYIVLTEKGNDFHTLYTDINNYTGNFDFGLSGGGEVLRLYADNNLLVDSVHYDNNLPWPEAADGTGATLELKNVWLDNDSAQNWQAVSGIHGTPGRVNSDIVIVINEPPHFPFEFELYANYPNPFNPSTKIRFVIAEAHNTSLKIYDVLGNEVQTLIDEFLNPGSYEIEFNASELSSGVYYCRLKAGKFVKTNKLMLLK